MWNIKNNKNESICKIETQTEYKLTFTKEREKGEGGQEDLSAQPLSKIFTKTIVQRVETL